MPSNSWYRVEWSSLAIGKVIASSKRKIVFKFGFVNEDAIANGLTGAECRGDEHEIVVGFSLSTGKRAIAYDRKEVYYTEGRSMQEGKFEHSWTIEGGHNVRISAHFSQPYGKRQYDMFIDGASFFSMPHIYELGSGLADERLKRNTQTILPITKDAGFGSDDDNVSVGYERPDYSCEVSSPSKQNEPSVVTYSGTGSHLNALVLNDNAVSPPVDLLDFSLDSSLSCGQTLALPSAYAHTDHQLALNGESEHQLPYNLENNTATNSLYTQRTSYETHMEASNPFLSYAGEVNSDSRDFSQSLTSTNPNIQYWNSGNSQIQGQNYGYNHNIAPAPVANISQGYYSNNQQVQNYQHPPPFQNNQFPRIAHPEVGQFERLPYQEKVHYSSPASPVTENKFVKGFEPISPTAVQDISQDQIQALQITSIEDRFSSIVNLDDMTAPFETPEQRRTRLRKEAKQHRSVDPAGAATNSTVSRHPMEQEVLRSHHQPSFARSGQAYAPQYSSPVGFSPGPNNSSCFQPQYQQTHF
jgi:hypothetical protein